MKKYLFLAVAFLLCLVSCKNNKTVEPEMEPEDTLVVPEGTYDFTKVLNHDIAENLDYVFYESTVQFDHSIMEHPAMPVYIMNIFQKNDTCMIITHDTNGVTTIDKKGGEYWLEDKPIDFKSVKYTWIDALLKIQSSELELNTNVMVFRQPLTKDNYQHPFYIFGTESTGFYAVSSETGEIEKW